LRHEAVQLQRADGLWVHTARRVRVGRQTVQDMDAFKPIIIPEPPGVPFILYTLDTHTRLAHPQ
jgi:hypothetical protein